jgi:acetolactate synthase-1/2/3 large subunit
MVSVPHPDPQALARFAEMLKSAKKPLAIVGGLWGDGREGLGEFLRAFNIPTAVGFRRQSLYPGTAANFAGDLGVGSDPALVAKVGEADLILALGTRLGEAVTQGYTLFDLAGATPIIHVYPDQAEIGRVFRPALGITSDLEVFAEHLAGLKPGKIAWGAWTAELRALREAAHAVPAYPGALNLAQVMHDLEGLLEPDAILTTDAGNFATWVARFLHFSEDQRFVGPCNGAMGYGVPAAIGAKIAEPARQTVCFVGDGGFLMTGQEIATAFHHGVAPIVLVFNNQMYGTIRMYQERSFPGRVSGTTLTNPDFAKFIESFGGHGEVVSETAEFAPAFRRAVASGKPAVIELRMNAEQITSRATITQLRASGAKAAAANPAAPKPARAKRAPSTTRPAKR